MKVLTFAAVAGLAAGFTPMRAPLRRSSLSMGRETEGAAVDCQMPDTVVRRLDKQDMPHISLADGEGIYEFWMSTTVPGGVTKDSMMKIEKDAAKNANFPGFKKGQIPPWAKPQLKAFCVEDAINNAILDAIESAELTALEGDDRKAEVVEDVKELTNSFKIGTPLSFTATVLCKQTLSAEAAAEGAVVDVEVKEEAPAPSSGTEMPKDVALRVKKLESDNAKLVDFIKAQGFEPPAKVAA
uniref:Trigger factor ribosome-binding bacterial domain-containing protein n=1 Tax=Florenciella parvula TaxID=236787 RepID=A0A7S2CEA7_9STRA